jgi:2,3-bisphosphoglycerate-dependent phosphoglycerate mutase
MSYRLLILFFLFASCQDSPEHPVTTLILVRHAEKANDGTDNPPLTAKGEARAEQLASLLGETGVEVIYSTPYTRNRETVKPLARKLNKEVREYNSGTNFVEQIDTFISQHAGKTIVVCGHSNTVPGLLNALVGEERYSNLKTDDYDNVYVAFAPLRGKARVVNLTQEVIMKK